MDVDAQGPSTPNRGEDGDGLGSDDDDPRAGDTWHSPVDVLDVLGRVVRFVVPASADDENAWKDVEAPTEADWARVSRAHAEKVRREREGRGQSGEAEGGGGSKGRGSAGGGGGASPQGGGREGPKPRRRRRPGAGKGRRRRRRRINPRW